MRLPLIVSPTLLIVAATAAEPTATAAAGPQPYYSSAASEPVKLEGVTDAKLVGKAKLFVTGDGGSSWKLAQEIAVPEGAAQVPEFAFAAPADGTYGFVTAATSRAGKAEPEPQHGTQPRSVLVVDRTAPALGRLDARLAAGATGEALAAGGKAPLQVEWSVSDANLLGTDPVTVEASLDGGKTFAALGKGAASGTLAAEVAPGKDAREVQVRVQARDLAGNVLTSAASSVLLPPKPANPDEMLAVAVKGLPTPGELGVGTRSTAAVLPPAEQEQPVTAKAGGKTEAPARPAKGEEPAKPAQPAKEPAKPAEAITPPRPAADPAAQPGDESVANDPARGNPTQKPAREQPARPPVKAKRGVTPEEGIAFLVGDEARQAFAEAQDLEQRKQIDDALDAYLRLHVSSLAKQAVAAELRLLRERGDHETIIGLVDALPAELRIDEAWLDQGRSYAQLNRHEDALASLARIRRDAPQAREGLLALARSLKALGRAEDAKRVYAKLAGGNDSISAAARAEM